MKEDLGSDDSLMASPSAADVPPANVEVKRVANWENLIGWCPASDDPLTAEAFAWADATKVGRGSGAYGYFVEAYVAGFQSGYRALHPRKPEQ